MDKGGTLSGRAFLPTANSDRENQLLPVPRTNILSQSEDEVLSRFGLMAIWVFHIAVFFRSVFICDPLQKFTIQHYQDTV